MDLQRVHQGHFRKHRLISTDCLSSNTIMSIENLAIKDQWYKFATYQTACHTKNRLQNTYFFPLFLFFIYLVVCIFVMSIISISIRFAGWKDGNENCY